jgi:hypothetical protein
MLLLLPQISRFSPTGIDPTSGRPVPVTQGSLLAIVRMIELIFGFFAMAGVMSADWGKGSFTTKDVKVGGWIGVAAAPAIIAALALMTLAAYQGKVAPLVVELQSSEPNVLRRSTSIITDLRPAEPPPLILRDAISQGIGGRVGGAVLLLFGLGALAPSVYASFSYAHRFKQAFGGLSRVAWMLVGTTFAWPIIATGATRDLELIFTLMGAVFAPMAAAFTVTSARDKREWTGPRSGVNRAALGGWIVGLLVGLIPVLPLGKLSEIQPAAVWGFLAAYAVTRILAGLGWDPPPATTSTEESTEST